MNGLLWRRTMMKKTCRECRCPTHPPALLPTLWWSLCDLTCLLLMIIKKWHFGSGSKGPFKQKFLQNRISKFWIFQNFFIKIFMTWNADLFSPLSLARTHLISFPVDSPHEITPGKRKKSTFQKVGHRSYFNSKEWYNMHRLVSMHIISLCVKK